MLGLETRWRDTTKHFIDKHISIKWPNDIYVDNRKIGGILIQNTISGRTIQNAIIGIGLNVNELSFPSSIPNPTSMAIESGKKTDLNSVKGNLLASLNEWYMRAQEIPHNIMMQQYTNHLYCLGEVCLFKQPDHDKAEPARITGVDDDGRILLKDPESGRVEAFALNQIRQIIA